MQPGGARRWLSALQLFSSVGASLKPRPNPGIITAIIILTTPAILPGGTPMPRSPRHRAPDAASRGWLPFRPSEPATGPAGAGISTERGRPPPHRSLPFGTKLRVTHGGRSVV